MEINKYAIYRIGISDYCIIVSDPFKMYISGQPYDTYVNVHFLGEEFGETTTVPCEKLTIAKPITQDDRWIINNNIKRLQRRIEELEALRDNRVLLVLHEEGVAHEG